MQWVLLKTVGKNWRWVNQRWIIIALEPALIMVWNAGSCYEQLRPWLYRPFPSSKNSHIQNEAKCKTFQVKISFICMGIKIIFISMALTSLWNTRLKATRKWPNGKHSYGRKFYFCIKAKAFLLSGHTRASYGREPYVRQLHDLQRFPSTDWFPF